MKQQSDRPDRKREGLLAAGRREFIEHGYAAAQVHRICESAGVGIGSFYERFTGKAALLLAVAEASFDEFLTTLNSASRNRRGMHETFASELLSDDSLRFRDAFREAMSSEPSIRTAAEHLRETQLSRVAGFVAAVREHEHARNGLLTPAEVAWLMLAIMRETAVGHSMQEEALAFRASRILDALIFGRPEEEETPTPLP